MTNEPDITFLDDITCRDCGVTMGNADGPMTAIFPPGTWICEPCFMGNYDAIGRCMIQRGFSFVEAVEVLAEERGLTSGDFPDF